MSGAVCQRCQSLDQRLCRQLFLGVLDALGSLTLLALLIRVNRGDCVCMGALQLRMHLIDVSCLQATTSRRLATHLRDQFRTSATPLAAHYSFVSISGLAAYSTTAQPVVTAPDLDPCCPGQPWSFRPRVLARWTNRRQLVGSSKCYTSSLSTEGNSGWSLPRGEIHCTSCGSC